MSIHTAHLEDLGFEKGIAFLWNNKERKLRLALNIGYDETEANLIIFNLESTKEYYLKLIREGKTISSISLKDTSRKDKINKLFRVDHFVISPILPKEGNSGFLFVGTESADTLFNRGRRRISNYPGG